MTHLGSLVIGSKEIVSLCDYKAKLNPQKELRDRERATMGRVEIISGTLEGEIRALGISGNGELVGLINSSNSREPLWPTVDGSLGLSEEESLNYARRFFNFGFCLLPWFWAVNRYYFWPVLHQSPSSLPRLRHYVVGSAIGFTAFSVVLSAWALTFTIGGEHLFGPVWRRLVMYNVADRLGLTGWN
ncbi:hypothetical protein GIB67_029800 [Kingdonia uniflora]|uniref:Gamma-secretase subunit PEN-2 n=1 Tax=Kingdonia uniflora TaxID=39325 RepID=A0A7J7NJM8_9MAGN|nr:hypothetical protein GIB67_029800 [Kingdonia uniflora]